MSHFIVFISNCFKALYNVLHVGIDVYNGITIYLSDILIVLLVFGFVITIYWKGAKA